MMCGMKDAEKTGEFLAALHKSLYEYFRESGPPGLPRKR